MSISSGAFRKAGPYNCNGSTVAFPFSFKVFHASDVLVVQTDLSGVETTKTLTTDYTVTLNANQDSNPGGTVMMNTAPLSGYLLTIGSQVTYTQGMVLTNTGGFFPQVINDMADRVVILVQQLYEKLSRAVTLPFSSFSSVSTTLPSPSPGMVIGWNLAGTGMSNFTPAGLGLVVAETAASGSAILPGGPTANRDASPGQGYFRFNSNTNQLEWFNGTSWVTVEDAMTLAAALALALASYYTSTQSDARYCTQSQADGRYGPIGATPIQGAFKNLQASATGTNANVSVSADEISLENGGNVYQTVRAVALMIAGTSVGANGLDTGTIAASTWYSLWIIWNGATVAGLMSLSATAPALPSGYTHKARVGWIRTDASGSKYPLSFKQLGRRVQYVVAAGSNVAAMPSIANGTAGSISTPTWAAAGVGNFVPSTASRIQVALQGYAAGAQTAMVAPNNSYGVYNSSTNPPPILVNTASAINTTLGELVLESANIYWASANASTALWCLGWEDNI